MTEMFIVLATIGILIVVVEYVMSKTRKWGCNSPKFFKDKRR